MILGISQPLECVGAIGNGILRGFKDTRRPMYFSVFAFWGVGFIGGVTLAFYFGMAGLCIWAGLADSSIAFGLLIGSRLLYRWKCFDFALVTA